MQTGNTMHDYSVWVVQSGDEVSKSFLSACQAANEETSVVKYFDKTGILLPWYSTKESIDGVGTKVQIYTQAFEWYIQEHERWVINDKQLLEKSIDIWERMLHDLIAMNTDDLRKWEMAVAVTNIIDINHLSGKRGKLFSDSMAKAMANVIRENDIMIIAWETAVLWNSKSTQEIIECIKWTFNIAMCLWYWRETTLQDAILQKIEHILQKIEFNIAGTSLGITSPWEKLFALRPWQSIIGLQEKEQNGIIWPRSNGITAIRKSMRDLTGDNWENKSFEYFLECLGRQRAKKIHKNIRSLCKWKKMWEIVVGKSTVFNPFISRKLLGWVDGEPQVRLSSLIHVTGNPLKKTIDGAPWVFLDIDISQMPIPTIIAILQQVIDISWKDALKWWNMWLPYALICDKGQETKIISLAREEGITARVIGETYSQSKKSYSTIRWVWVHDETIIL